MIQLHTNPLPQAKQTDMPLKYKKVALHGSKNITIHLLKWNKSSFVMVFIRTPYHRPGST